MLVPGCFLFVCVMAVLSCSTVAVIGLFRAAVEIRKSRRDAVSRQAVRHEGKSELLWFPSFHAEQSSMGVMDGVSTKQG